MLDSNSEPPYIPLVIIRQTGAKWMSIIRVGRPMGARQMRFMREIVQHIYQELKNYPAFSSKESAFPGFAGSPHHYGAARIL
jgi:hypothetical protein